MSCCCLVHTVDISLYHVYLFSRYPEDISQTCCRLVNEDQVIADIPNKKLFVTSDKPVEELLATIRKTGKKTEYVGVA